MSNMHPTSEDCTCNPHLIDLQCPWNGIYPDGIYCPTCDEDRHCCPGCGAVSNHWESVCADCQRERA